MHFVDESLVVYPSAASLVVYNTETKTQKFVPNTPDTEGITAVAIASNRKFLAVAEKADDAVITIYDLQTYKKRKTLQTKQVESQVRCRTRRAEQWQHRVLTCSVVLGQGSRALFVVDDCKGTYEA